jgi:EAL domain-containing protein (putative c-di-GMP-specific phosphodiesterase class I)
MVLLYGVLITKSLSIRVIAEGVETEVEYQWLQESGVDYVQGYYFSKPDKPENLSEYSKCLKSAFC